VTWAQDFVGDFEVDRTSPLPAYYQLQDWLTQRIDSGELAPGTRVPSERELTEPLGLSRMTVRHALDRLQRDGRLARRRGSGTFVAPALLVSEIGELRGISAELAAQGHSSQTRVLGVNKIRAPQLVCEALNIVPRAHAIRVQRVRLVDGEPLSFETSWLHPVHCAAILREDLSEGSLTRLIVERCGRRLERGHERITATVLDDFEAEQLGTFAGAAAFRVQRTTYEAPDVAVEIAISILRGDRFSFEAVLGRTLIAKRTPTLARRQNSSVDHLHR
jgi:GntR family transcriptional regulator